MRVDLPLEALGHPPLELLGLLVREGVRQRQHVFPGEFGKFIISDLAPF